MTNLNKKSIIIPHSGTLEKLPDRAKLQRNSTMGFCYQAKTHKLSFSGFNSSTLKNTQNSQEEYPFANEKIIEENNEKINREKRPSSEIQKLKNLQFILHNKDLKKKEQELSKLLFSKFNSKFLQNISNLKVNTNATSSSDYYSKSKQGKTLMITRPTTSLGNDKIFFPGSRFHERKRLLSSPYHPNKNDLIFEGKNKKSY